MENENQTLNYKRRNQDKDTVKLMNIKENYSFGFIYFRLDLKFLKKDIIDI